VNVYEAIVRDLEGIGVDTAFGGNGENIASLALALTRSEKIRPVLTRHEQAASFMACGHAMFTKRLGVCFATVGPGAFNLFSGLAVALSDSYPVLAITGYVALEWRGKGAVNDTSGAPGTPDSQAMFAATTKGSFLLERAEDTCDVLEQAVNLAFEGRPGPVHLHVPQNLTYRGVEVRNFREMTVSAQPPQPKPDEVAAVADVLAEALRSRRKVLLLAGFGAVRSEAYDETRTFAERFGVPVVTTLDGKGIIPEDHPLCAGVFSESGHSSAWRAFREADVVLAVGNSLNQHATFGLREDLFDDKTLLQVNISADEIGRMYPAREAIVADARPALAALADEVSDRLDSRPDPTSWADTPEEKDHFPHLPGHIHPAALAQSMGRMLPDDAVLLADAGAHLAWLGLHVRLRQGQNFRKCGTFGPMSAHTNAAIGVKAAEPARTVVVGCGDGCYQMAGFELMTAIDNDLPVIWVIFNDAEFKLVKLYQLGTYGKSGLVDLRGPDFAAYAEACGGDGYCVDSIGDFEEAFAHALAKGRPAVIDVRITRWALPHYSTSPEGMLKGAWETLEKRFHDAT
jgi:thiamine pyrophosphate-dependent acetolactate synthase large subunit-like protein